MEFLSLDIPPGAQIKAYYHNVANALLYRFLMSPGSSLVNYMVEILWHRNQIDGSDNEVVTPSSLIIFCSWF